MPEKIVLLESFHYPARPRYFYPGALVYEDEAQVQIFHPQMTPLWSGHSNRIGRINEHTLSVLFTDRNFNVIIWWNGDWSFSAYYVNIALPAEREDQFCRYVDLDLDVLLITERSVRRFKQHTEPGVYVLDRDEYEERKVLFNYPPEVMESAEQGLEEALAAIEARRFPFDDSLLDWRPSASALALANLPDDAAAWHLKSER
ncbi:MAG TPA: DUF402 domain-containing protein [Chloroflexia bacterium]|nr:DUF402 domain-containing protein [Chloroflexia bacterium]